MAKKPTTKPHKVVKLNQKLLMGMIEEVEDEYDLTANTLIAKKRISTGILALDMQWGGGMVPGMYTLSAIEKAGKSTAMTTIFGNMVRAKVPITILRDAEGTVGNDPEYTIALLGGLDISDMMSDSTKTKDMFKPRIHVVQNLEKTYEFLRKILVRLPDKFYSVKNKSWMFKAEDTKEGQAQMALLGDPDAVFKEKRGKKTFLYAYADDDLVGFIGIDSYPALIPNNVEEDDERSKAMGQEARAFSTSIPLIVEKLVNKGFVIIGANQLRENINANGRGPAWKEWGGNALRQYSSVREWLTAVSPSSMKTTPALWSGGKEQGLWTLCEETSVEEPSDDDNDIDTGKDYYQMVYFLNQKNKNSIPYTRVEMRIWTRDRRGKGRGIDPVFDTWFYLVRRNLATVHSRRITCEKFFGEKKPHWDDFKRLILAEVSGTPEDVEAVWKKLKIKPKILNIREWCFKDLRRITNADAKGDVDTNVFENVIEKTSKSAAKKAIQKAVTEAAKKVKSKSKPKASKTSKSTKTAPDRKSKTAPKPKTKPKKAKGRGK